MSRMRVGHPVRVEHVEVGQLLAGGREHHRLAGQRRDRQRGAAAGVAVELGQHHAVVADAVEERLRGRHRVLADHRVDDEQHLVRVGRVADRGGLRHHLRVDAETAGGVDDDDVVQRALGLVDRPPRHRHRVADAVAGLGREHRDARPARRPPAAGSTAFGRCRSAATSSGVLPCSFSHSASLPASVVLPEPCRPASMITVGGFLANRSRRVSPPRIVTSSSCTILMTCCAGFSACETSAPAARSLTRAMNCRTTGSATSASSRAMRISRAVASMSAGTAAPCRAARRRPGSADRRASQTHLKATRPSASYWMIPNGRAAPHPQFAADRGGGGQLAGVSADRTMFTVRLRRSGSVSRPPEESVT